MILNILSDYFLSKFENYKLDQTSAIEVLPFILKLPFYRYIFEFYALNSGLMPYYVVDFIEYLVILPLIDLIDRWISDG